MEFGSRTKYISVPQVCEILYSPSPESHLQTIMDGLAAGYEYRFADYTPLVGATSTEIVAEVATWHNRNRTNPVRDFFRGQMMYASEAQKRKLIADLRDYLAELES